MFLHSRRCARFHQQRLKLSIGPLISLTSGGSPPRFGSPCNTFVPPPLSCCCCYKCKVQATFSVTSVVCPLYIYIAIQLILLTSSDPHLTYRFRESQRYPWNRCSSAASCGSGAG
ncbi:hypothetical protein FIBSPDRAFT_1043721 [Athelia psychrophila]|uniref:Uncharacterized protein n=1 Tax=Athelia psychrophila TaxID=1759441 RepID=A0A166KU05_9AGAM|nr:hypothetical protein FIBSPDRAFT_1043721 [Fibularhizoctonia sp. CBS 109695]